MKLNNQDANFIAELQGWAEQMLALRGQAELLLARWFLNGTSARLTDAEIQTLFPHLTADEVTAAVDAMRTVLDALGNNVSGQAVNLIRMKE